MRSPSAGTSVRWQGWPKIPSGAESHGTWSRFASARASRSASATVASAGNSTFHSHCSSRVAYANTQRLRSADPLLVPGSGAVDERIDERRRRLLEEGFEDHRGHRIAEREAHV